MIFNWYMHQQVHEQNMQERQREAQAHHLAQIARAKRPQSHRLNAALTTLRRSLTALRPRQARPGHTPKRERGATA